MLALELSIAYQTTWETGGVNVDGELLVQQVEHLVLGVGGVHEVHARTDVGGGAASSDKLHRKRVAIGIDTVGTGIIATVKSAVGRTGGWVRAEGGIPGVTLLRCQHIP